MRTRHHLCHATAWLFGVDRASNGARRKPIFKRTCLRVPMNGAMPRTYASNFGVSQHWSRPTFGVPRQGHAQAESEHILLYPRSWTKKGFFCLEIPFLLVLQGNRKDTTYFVGFTILRHAFIWVDNTSAGVPRKMRGTFSWVPTLAVE